MQTHVSLTIQTCTFMIKGESKIFYDKIIPGFLVAATSILIHSIDNNGNCFGQIGRAEGFVLVKSISITVAAFGVTKNLKLISII